MFKTAKWLPYNKSTTQFSDILKKYLSTEENTKFRSSLAKNIDNSKYLGELEKAIMRIMKKKEREKNQQSDVFKKLKANLQKKK